MAMRRVCVENEAVCGQFLKASMKRMACTNTALLSFPRSEQPKHERIQTNKICPERENETLDSMKAIADWWTGL